ncbi:hypothetical protein [Thermobispora bispora]|uniref:hypothetical protein n=1 Tax=Thermobispora bispora TaxID=2006 RepID=UPI00197EE0FF|nr:hypothetical protein [Thermobispora bispora]QSI49958.1 hypothetical protein CYL17_18435 [Thermobispora bispora]
MRTLADADPLPRVLAHLQNSPALVRLLGGEDASAAQERIGADHQPPYPRLRVRPDGGGSEDPTTLLVVQTIRLEALDSLDHPSGDEHLSRVLAYAVHRVHMLPGLPTEGGPVITAVRSTMRRQPIPEADGRNRWVTVLEVHAHPTPC